MTTSTARATDRVAAAAGAVFEPETVLPSQLLDTAHRGATLQPEKRLLLAILEDAVAALQRGAVTTTRSAATAAAEARQWVLDDRTDWPCSFVNVCHVLGLDPAYLRLGLERWAAQAQRRAASGTVIPFRHAFRRVSGSRTRAVVPRRLRR
jgi:hypothetical protein